MDLFVQNKRAIFNVVVFEEFIKEIIGILFVKELCNDMLDIYESC